MKILLWFFTISIGLFMIVMAVIYTLQERLIFFPEKLPKDYRFTFTSSFKEVFLTAQDGVTLHALYFVQDRPKGVILYLHGNAGSLRSWGYVAEDLVRYGYNVLIMDYRSFGKSGGKLSPGALFSDAQLMYDFLLKQFSENDIVVFGRSLGTGIAVKIAADNNPKLVLLETPYYNFADVAKAHYAFLPVSLLLKYTFPSDKYALHVKCPTYILHGTADEVVPYESGQKLVKRLKQPGGLITIEGGHHNNLEAFALYQQALKRILD